MTRARSRLLCIAAAVLFSSGGAVIKGAQLTAWQTASFRSAIAAAVLVLFAPAARRPPRGAWVVGLAYAATVILFVVANTLTTAAHTSFLQATAPLYLLFLAPLLLGERIRRSELFTLAWMAAGMALLLLASGEAQESAPRPLLGNALGVLLGGTWALTVLGLRWLDRGGTPVLAAVVAGNALAFLLALAPALTHGGLEVGGRGLLSLVWLGGFQVALAYLALARAVPHLRAMEVALLLLLEPVLTPLWAWISHGERPPALALVGGAIVLAAGLRRGEP